MALARVETPLKRILDNEGRRQSWLAQQVGATPAQVHGWVHGLHLPVDATQRRIAQALGRTVDEVFPSEDLQSSEAA